jgi:hypothetical protein
MRMISRRKQITILGQGGDQHGWGVRIYKNTAAVEVDQPYSGEGVQLRNKLRIGILKDNVQEEDQAVGLERRRMLK